MRENQSPQALEGLIEGELVSLVQVARWQVLVSDDRGILRGVGANLRVVRVGVGLLAPLACDGVVIGVAEQWGADSVHDGELELVIGEWVAQGASATGPAGRAAGDGEKDDCEGKLESHLLMNQTRPPGPKSNAQRNQTARPRVFTSNGHEWSNL